MATTNDTIQPDANIPTAPTSNPNQKNKLPLIIGVVALVTLFSAGAYYLGSKSLTPVNKQPEVQKVVDKPADLVDTSVDTPLFSGQLKKVTENLKIFKTTESDVLNGVENNFVYYEAGKFSRGELKDYTRIVAIRLPEGPGQALTFILATKDFQNYILDDPDNKTTKYPQDDWQNPYSILDATKVISTKTFDTEQPKQLDLNQDYSLYADRLPIDSVQTGQDANGYSIYETLLDTYFRSYQKLASPFNQLTLYFNPRDPQPLHSGQTQKYKDNEQLMQTYIAGTTEVIAVDSAGLPMIYALTTPENIEEYNDGKTEELPNMGFAGSRIKAQPELQFYKDYKIAIPGGCAFSLNSIVVNVTDNDLEKIGTIFDLPLYRLKNTDHPLLELAFNNKMDYYNLEPTAWDTAYKGIKKPTLSEYVKSNPLLFVKDYWQRWIALGEYDIMLPGGCGKPVIYLYPEQPTVVSVKFQAPIQFTTDIPKYGDFWKVTAYPNGSLVNLKPQLTDCSQIPTKKGSEYAQEACKNNTYPYLYWAGNINSRDYPATRDGWIVDRSNLSTFLQTTLTEVGFNKNEKTDFLDYWIPDMLAKDTPYYFISFLQTNQLNSLFPMTIDPTPNTTFRIFLNYIPLTSKPTSLPQPQKLNKLIRNGFTLVEWGGLKRP